MNGISGLRGNAWFRGLDKILAETCFLGRVVGMPFNIPGAASRRGVPRLHRIARCAEDSVPLGMANFSGDPLREIVTPLAMKVQAGYRYACILVSHSSCVLFGFDLVRVASLLVWVRGENALKHS
jgi:hypothetical protein